MLIEFTQTTVTVDWREFVVVIVLLALLAWSAVRLWQAVRRSPRVDARGSVLPHMLDAVKDWLGVRNAGWAGTLILAAVIVAFALLFVMAVIASFRLIGTVIVGAEAASPQSLGLGALLVALLGAPFLIWRSVVAQKTLDTTMHGQVTQRINEAVAALGAEREIKREVQVAGRKEVREWSEPNMEVRIGAILALARIAQENLDFHVQVMQILCAYVRQNSPASTAKAFPSVEHWVPGREDETDYEGWERARLWFVEDFLVWRESIQIRADVQTAIDVLGRRSVAQRNKEGCWPEPSLKAQCANDVELPILPDFIETDDLKVYTRWDASVSSVKNPFAAGAKIGSVASVYRLDLRVRTHKPA